MSPEHIVRSWKDPGFGATLDVDAAASLPANPVGRIEIADRALDPAGASAQIARTEYGETLWCCHGLTQYGKCDLTAGYPICSEGCFTIFMTAMSICG